MQRKATSTISHWIVHTSNPAEGTPLRSAFSADCPYWRSSRELGRYTALLRQHFFSLLSPYANIVQPAEQEIPSVISHLPQFSHLLCNPCRSVVPYKTLYHHLRHHHNIRHLFCKTIIPKYEDLSVSQTNANIEPLPAGSSPLEFLASPEPGYFCLHCDYTTVSWDVLLDHFF
ncbi:hypothetical protein BU25DRAFT_259539 [Macroventuria anomochaeta]|uniref:Uncharacterized protein n=1 Tax=Macroventuria anomochaeta TaxID=301207 RepID=A0ACB6S983_9PLEO|nr:uncharacterized protein BU25DRAFT_259539 [Macroventuria anomochaeta]KAF2630538.1 hypothetical protein BU25DRAFT_259539 [Macroventuria anomochaeta]